MKADAEARQAQEEAEAGERAAAEEENRVKAGGRAGALSELERGEG